MTAPMKLAHVVLKSGQKDVLAAWYVTVLSARVQHSDERLTFLTYDDEHHRVAIAQMPGGGEPAPPTNAGLSHFAFTHSDLTTLLTSFEELRSKGIEPVWTVNHGPTASIYYLDPDRNMIEFQVDLFEPDACNEYMRSARFTDNPIGVKFDPAEFLARLRSGTSEDELMAELRRVDGPIEYLPGRRPRS